MKYFFSSFVMSTKHSPQELEETIQYKKQKLDTNPIDNNNIQVESSTTSQSNNILEEGNVISQEGIKEEEILKILNTNYFDPDFIGKFCFSFKKNRTFTDETSQAIIYNSPFP